MLLTDALFLAEARGRLGLGSHSILEASQCCVAEPFRQFGFSKRVQLLLAKLRHKILHLCHTAMDAI